MQMRMILTVRLVSSRLAVACLPAEHALGDSLSLADYYMQKNLYLMLVYRRQSCNFWTLQAIALQAAQCIPVWMKGYAMHLAVRSSKGAAVTRSPKMSGMGARWVSEPQVRAALQSVADVTLNPNVEPSMNSAGAAICTHVR